MLILQACCVCADQITNISSLCKADTNTSREAGVQCMSLLSTIEELRDLERNGGRYMHITSMLMLAGLILCRTWGSHGGTRPTRQ